MINSPAVLAQFPLSDSQKRAALARGDDVAVTAGAGTGKTRTLVARYLALLADGLPLRKIVAVTFTRKAAREMRNRVRQEIGKYLRQANLGAEEREIWQTTYNELDAARIGTIHNLCAEILRAHPAEAAIDPRFTVLDETQAALMVQDAVEATLAWAVEQEAMTDVFDLMHERQLQDLIATLLSKGAAVAFVIEKLPASEIFSHWQIELQNQQARTLDMLLSVPEFRAAEQILARNQAVKDQDRIEVQRQMALRVLDSLAGEALPAQLRNLALLSSINLVGGSQKSWPGGKDQLNEVKSALKCLREMYRERPLLALSLNEQDEALAAAMPAIYELYQYARMVYQALKDEWEGLDFDDLEALAIGLLESQAAVRDYWHSQVQALLVDEFQDTNEYQCGFIRLLCPDAGKLFIVGDAKQSIYRFRGADVSVFAQEKERIERQKGALIDLETSYRAHELLLEGMNGLLRPVLGDDTPDRPVWVAPFAPLKAAKTRVEDGLAAPFIEFHLTIGNKPEALPLAAAAAAERLAQIQEGSGLEFGDMAILCRASGSFQYYENAFDDAGIPYVTVAGKGFYDRPEIRDLLNALLAIADPHDDLALTGLLRSPAVGISDVTLYRLRQKRLENYSLWEMLQREVGFAESEQSQRLETAVSLIHDLQRQAGRLPVADVLKQFLDRSYYRAILRRSGQLRALRNVAKFLNDIHGSELVSVAEFLEYAQALRDSGSREGEARATAGGAVQIMSIHAAKGLEFPVVVLGDAGSGGRRSAPIAVDAQLGILLASKNEDEVQATSYKMWSESSQEQDKAETARLLYVALTRAEQMLLISGTVRKNKSGGLSWKGWLLQLAEIVGFANVDLSGFDESGGERTSFEGRVEETAVQAVFYEPQFVTRRGSPAARTGEAVEEQPTPSGMQEAVERMTRSEMADDDRIERVWQVIPTAKRPTAPAWMVGKIVHEALALWRFEGPQFDDWVKARAREFGLTDKRQLRNAHTETMRLLGRFKRSQLFKEIDASAKRMHEVPYSYEEQGVMKTGYIDLLYRDAGRWVVLDFKTDKARSEADIERLLQGEGYGEQLTGYGRAVQHLLGVVPRLDLCLLNFSGEVRVVADIGNF